jgi:hypothetical protein
MSAEPLGLVVAMVPVVVVLYVVEISVSPGRIRGDRLAITSPVTGI